MAKMIMMIDDHTKLLKGSFAHTPKNNILWNMYEHRYLNWRSNHSKSFLLGIIKGQIHRAHYLCDLKEDLMEELSFLRDVFVMNSYPLKLVNEVINKSWEEQSGVEVLQR